MQGKAISLRVGNTQHLIPKIIMFPHRTPVLRTLCMRYRVSSIEGCFGLGLGLGVPTGCKLVFHPQS